VQRRSTISAVRHKQGASGHLVFVILRHEITVAGDVCISEEQNLVYRSESSTTSIATRPAEDAPIADLTRRFTPDPVQLFRFSALTFNAHRIHYDRDYARDVESYPGLVVQGPFLATLLADHFHRAAPERRVTQFEFRAQRPLFDSAPADLCLGWTPDGAALWTRDADGHVTMTAELKAD
jgi:3-methylfumaryl-CoA hydratase